MESPPNPSRLPPPADRVRLDRTPGATRPPLRSEYPGDRKSAPVLPEQGRPSERQEMSRKSAEDISRKIRQDGVRHLLTGRAAGHSEYSYGGNAFARSFILDAMSIRTKIVP